MQPVKRFGGIKERTEYYWSLMLFVIRYGFFQDHRTHISRVICLKTEFYLRCFVVNIRDRPNGSSDRSQRQ